LLGLVAGLAVKNLSIGYVIFDSIEILALILIVFNPLTDDRFRFFYCHIMHLEHQHKDCDWAGADPLVQKAFDRSAGRCFAWHRVRLQL